MKFEDFVLNKVYMIDFGAGWEKAEFVGEAGIDPNIVGFSVEGGYYVKTKKQLESLPVREMEDEQ